MSDAERNLVSLSCPSCGGAISVSTSAGTNAFACPLCEAAFELESSAGQAATTPSTASKATASKAAAPLHRPTQKSSSGLVALITILVVGGAVGVVAFFASQTPVGKPADEAVQDAWPVATQSGHTIEGVTVRVQSVGVGAVRAKNADGTVFVSDRDDYWTVRLRVHNGGKTPIEFQTWHAVEFPGATPANASLKDDEGNAFVMQQFEDVAVLQGQTLKKTLDPRDSTTDVIVFEAPEGFDREKLKELRLELPGVACQVQGVFRQVIPKALVE